MLGETLLELLRFVFGFMSAGLGGLFVARAIEMRSLRSAYMAGVFIAACVFMLFIGRL